MKVMQWQDEADDLAAKARGVRQAGDRLAADDDPPRVGPIEAGDEVQQGALARA